MDPTTALAAEIPFAPAPANTDPQTVILWVIGTLVVVLFIVCRTLWQQALQARIDCKGENAEAKSDAKMAREKVEELLSGTLSHYGDACARMTRTLDRTNDVLDQNTRVFQKFIDTDRIERKH
jgi:hypothetical protein